jgi:protein phosphatase
MGNVDDTVVSLFDGSGEENSRRIFSHMQERKKWWGRCTFSEMFGELEIIITCPDDISHAKEALKQHFRKEFDFLRETATVIETQNFIFVHGGLHANNIQNYDGYTARSFMKFDGFMDRDICFDKYVIAGHFPAVLYSGGIPKLDPSVNEQKKIISIDGGCGVKEAGQLNALIIPHINAGSDEFSNERYDDFPVRSAVTAQAESADSIYIRWTDRRLEILEKGEAISKVRHITSGRVLDMPNLYIRDFGENAHCGDYTDYCHEVHRGDKLSIIKETPFGYSVKKNGILGWYKGELE